MNYTLPFAISFFLLLTSAHAAGVTPPLPGGGTTLTGGTSLEMVGSLYAFSISVGAVLAFGAIVYGAVKYAIARGNPADQSDAKDRITQALLGLLLLLGAYLILNTINPQLTTLNLPSLQNLQLPQQ